MNQAGVVLITGDYYRALIAENAAIMDLAEQQAKVTSAESFVLSTHYELGDINGKNADIRKHQEIVTLEKAPIYTEEVLACRELERKVLQCSAERKRQEAVIKLTTAWLYSQAGVVP